MVKSLARLLPGDEVVGAAGAFEACFIRILSKESKRTLKIRPTVAEQITLEAIPKALQRLAEGARPRQNCRQSAKLIRVSVGHMVLTRATTAVVSAQLADETSVAPK